MAIIQVRVGRFDGMRMLLHCVFPSLRLFFGHWESLVAPNAFPHSEVFWCGHVGPNGRKAYTDRFSDTGYGIYRAILSGADPFHLCAASVGIYGDHRSFGGFGLLLSSFAAGKLFDDFQISICKSGGGRGVASGAGRRVGADGRLCAGGHFQNPAL